MNLDVDKQTFNDLALFQNNQHRQSIFNLFNNTKTIGGKEKLEDIFNMPLTSTDHIKERIEVLSYIQTYNLKFNADKNTCDFIEFYLEKRNPVKSFAVITGFLERIIYSFNSNSDYYIIQQGVINTLNLLEELLKFVSTVTTPLPKVLEGFLSTIVTIFETSEFSEIKQLFGKEKYSTIEIAKADYLFRHIASQKVKELLAIVYELDVYQTVSLIGKTLGFSLPSIPENEKPKLIINGLFHPFINNPVVNDMSFSLDKNVCFITGTNMAGKSTLLKAIGIAVYLSQLGFPVPAAEMQTSIFKGLITTINLSDDIDEGHSHFYKEVLRVKQVAEKINLSQSMFVIFDELFRGTNVKDAYDASLAIIAAFSKVKTCFFIISTHIVEVAHDLAHIDNIGFRYMETVFDGANPVNSYKLKQGITEERLGMWIVKNERILEIIENSIKK